MHGGLAAAHGEGLALARKRSGALSSHSIQPCLSRTLNDSVKAAMFAPARVTHEAAVDRRRFERCGRSGRSWRLRWRRCPLMVGHVSDDLLGQRPRQVTFGTVGAPALAPGADLVHAGLDLLGVALGQLGPTALAAQLGVHVAVRAA